MPTYLCPKGHQSTEPDYCSECGAKMSGAKPGTTTPAATQAAASPENCPDCATPRSPDIAFCEICGYNFVSGAHGDLSAIPPPVIFPPTPAPAPPPSAQWTATLAIDPALQDPASPPPPADLGPFTFPLATPASLIGRRSEPRAIYPEIPVQHDDAVSHRHALLQLAPDGTLTLRDIGSANGTRLNGTDLKPMTDYPLKAGDVIAFGHWSTLTVTNGTSIPAEA